LHAAIPPRDRQSYRSWHLTTGEFQAPLTLIHTAAYWLLHGLRGLAPKGSFWRDAQFDTIRLALIKVAGRVTERATRIRIALPSCYPHQDSLALLAARTAKLPP
jgi:Transposase DDE domain group 1